jgi:uncharacterized membrane protein YheB (UPF0754 family)
MTNSGMIVLCIPLIAGFIGWFTNWLAIKALMYPVKFVGIPPVFGWQGVMPKNAVEMSLSFSKLIREQLIDMDALFKDMKHGDNDELDKLVDKVSNQVLEEFSTNIAPDKWERSREKLREYISNLIHKNVREMVEEMMDRIGDQAQDIVDIDKIMTDTMKKDRSVMGAILFEIATPEFKFIEMSGLYFGLAFGLLQMFIWMVYPAYWVLPVAGFLVGYATNWMALHLIFEPREPVKIGPFSLQGVFIKRQYEVSEQFANVICDKVLNTRNLIQHMNQEPARSKIMEIIEEHIDSSMQVYEKDTMVAMLASKEKLQEAKADLKQRVRNADMESDDGPLQSFANQTTRIKRQIIDSLRKLNSSDFVGILRPVFQKDEWKLLLVGGVIGVVIGSLQYLYLFKGSI